MDEFYEGYVETGTHTQFPFPSEENPLAHVTSEFLFGRQLPSPSEKYSLGQSWECFNIAGMQLPDPLLINPLSHKIGSKSITQFPFPSLLYPLGHIGFWIIFDVIFTHVPLESS